MAMAQGGFCLRKELEKYWSKAAAGSPGKGKLSKDKKSRSACAGENQPQKDIQPDGQLALLQSEVPAELRGENSLPPLARRRLRQAGKRQAEADAESVDDISDGEVIDDPCEPPVEKPAAEKPAAEKPPCKKQRQQASSQQVTPAGTPLRTSGKSGARPGSSRASGPAKEKKTVEHGSSGRLSRRQKSIPAKRPNCQQSPIQESVPIRRGRYASEWLGARTEVGVRGRSASSKSSSASSSKSSKDSSPRRRKRSPSRRKPRQPSPARRNTHATAYPSHAAAEAARATGAIRRSSNWDIQPGTDAAIKTLQPKTVAVHQPKRRREVYCGNLAAGLVSDIMLRDLFNRLFYTIPGFAETYPDVSNVVVSTTWPPQSLGMFAFVEFVDEVLTVTAMQMSGIELLGRPVKVGRPQGFFSCGSNGTFADPPPLDVSLLRQLGHLPLLPEEPCNAGCQKITLTNKLRELYFGNLTTGQVDETVMLKLLTPICTQLPEYKPDLGVAVTKVSMSTDPLRAGTYCFVMFQSAELASRALTIFNETELFGRSMKVSRPAGVSQGPVPRAITDSAFIGPAQPPPPPLPPTATMTEMIEAILSSGHGAVLL